MLSKKQQKLTINLFKKLLDKQTIDLKSLKRLEDEYFFNEPLLVKEMLKDGPVSKSKIYSVLKSLEKHGIMYSYTTKRLPDKRAKPLERKKLINELKDIAGKEKVNTKEHPFFRPYFFGPKTKAYYFTPFGLDLAIHLCLAEGEDYRDRVFGKMFCDISAYKYA